MLALKKENARLKALGSEHAQTVLELQGVASASVAGAGMKAASAGQLR